MVLRSRTVGLDRRYRRHCLLRNISRPTPNNSKGRNGLDGPAKFLSDAACVLLRADKEVSRRGYREIMRRGLD